MFEKFKGEIGFKLAFPSDLKKLPRASFTFKNLKAM